VTAADAAPRSNQAEQALPALARAACQCASCAYAVGGYVRDRLLGIETADVDVVVTDQLREIAERLGAELHASVVPLHDEQPTIRLAFRDRSHIDLTIPRAGPALDGSEIPPDQRPIIADLLARDFTINAMAVPLQAVTRSDWRAHVVDPAAGLGDLDLHLVRATNPGVWKDDPLRLWRALRLAAQLGFDLDDATAQTLREHSDLALKPATERVRDEFFALLTCPNASIWLARSADLGLLFRLLPELAALQSLSQGGYHHLDGWQHTLAVAGAMDELARHAPGMSAEHQEALRGVFRKSVSGGRPRLALLKLAALLHDAGKPSTRAEDDEGYVHFYGHEKVSAAMARAVGERLRLGRRELHYLETATKLHMYPALLAQQEISRRAAHRFFRRAGNVAPDILVLAWADRLSARGPAALPEHIERVERAIRWLLSEWLGGSPLSHPQPPVGARAIMRRYGLQPGPEVGRALRVLSRRHAEQPFSDAESAWSFLDRLVACSRAGGGRTP
jgi:poly(A) polymerase